MNKKRIFLYAAIFLLFCTAGLACYFGLDTFRFHRTAKSYFQENLENDALSLNYTLANPQDYGIRLQSAALPVYSRQSRQESLASDKIYLQQLSHIDAGQLSPQDAYTWQLLFSYLTISLEEEKFPYFEEPLSPNSGMQSQLPLLLAEYRFSSKKDVETYLSLLSSIPDYFESLALYEQEKAEAGLCMPDCDLQDVIAQCDAIFEEASLKEGSHFLQQTFAERITSLVKSGVLSEEEAQSYRDKNNLLLLTVVLPAYQKLGDSLTLLEGSEPNAKGLCAYPNGQSYYAWLLKKTTGSSRTPSEIMDLLNTYWVSNKNTLQEFIAQYEEETKAFPDPAVLNQDFPLSEPSRILTDLKTRMQDVFPALSSFTTKNIQAQVKDVSPALEPFTSPAYYLTSPLDDPYHNVICINQSQTSQGIDLYTTLAHEGYPGHLYQTAYSHLYELQNHGLPVRELIFYGGYVEGWAYYVEMLSFEYAAAVMMENGASESTLLLCRIAALERALQINLFCMLDLSIHYFGLSYEDAVAFLTNLGFSAEGADAIYRYIRSEPATYLKYFLGYLEFLELRKQAAALWGENFSLKAFHTFVLNAGCSDFDNLRLRLAHTVDEKAQ